ncbi:SLC13 family permease [Rhizocola hellebori]|uniref:SLC13 family permease n=1 Tax=Rhizocola hellebori TaxID=1392758 RepID=A0A8J3QBE3_9ACTN|nr:SLC13 family permease [Rhizocola hellebori]GIH06471.1 SLC13 family permease [Rhizocola hellebori]
MSHAAISFVVLGAAVALFIWNRLPVEVVAVGSALVLYFCGVLSAAQTLAGFGDQVVVFITALFIVSQALDSSGVTAWAGQQLITRASTPQRRLLLMMLLVAGLTALISVNGAVAALLPMVVLMAVRSGQSPSRLVMPLAFAAHAGSLLLFTGTPINVIVSEAAQDASGHGFGFFEFSLVGVPLLAGTIAIIMAFGNRLLPDRVPHSIPPDLSGHARTLIKQYRLDEHAYRLQGRRPASYPAGVAVVGAQGPDTIIVRGESAAVQRFAADNQLQFLAEPAATHLEGALITPDYGVAEVVVGPRSGLVGTTVFPGMTTDSGDLIILAVQRKGLDAGRQETVLAIGDTLLLQGTWRALDRNIDADPGVLAVDDPEAVRRQAAPLGALGIRAIAVLAGMVLLLAVDLVPPAIAGLIAAGAMILLRVIPPTQAYRGIPWSTVILVAGMIPVSTAIAESGAADTMAQALVSLVGDRGPYLLLAGIFVFTATLGQIISNTATALIIVPIAIAAATELEVSIRPVLMCVAVAATAALLTPVATPANMMIKGPGGYRFGDYWKLGLPILLLFGVVSVGVVPLFWPL